MTRDLYGSFTYTPTKIPEPVVRKVAGSFGPLEFEKNARGEPMSPQEWINGDRKIPTLGKLYQGFSVDRDPELRQSILDNAGKAEVTATFINYLGGTKAELIEEPTQILQKRNKWTWEGGNVRRIDVPESDGWVTEYDNQTGFPVKTSQNQPDAVKVFGDEASYFWRSHDKGLRSVLRSFSSDSGPFDVAADWDPGARYSSVGVRPCSR